MTTDRGDIRAGHVVTAGGPWARDVGRMVCLELPVLAMEHMHLVTDDMPEVEAYNRETGREMPHGADFEGGIHPCQEGRGMLRGACEKACKPWSPAETPRDFGHERLQPDLDRIAPSPGVGFEHFPAFGEAGIRRIVNGPFCFAPDGNTGGLGCEIRVEPDCQRLLPDLLPEAGKAPGIRPSGSRALGGLRVERQ